MLDHVYRAAAYQHIDHIHCSNNNSNTFVFSIQFNLFTCKLNSPEANTKQAQVEKKKHTYKIQKQGNNIIIIIIIIIIPLTQIKVKSKIYAFINNSIQFFIIYVPSQQPNGQLQPQYSLDAGNLHYRQHKYPYLQ
jgi:hypothetical protein